MVGISKTSEAPPTIITLRINSENFLQVHKSSPWSFWGTKGTSHKFYDVLEVDVEVVVVGVKLLAAVLLCIFSGIEIEL